MQVTKQQLKKVIKEVLQAILKEQLPRAGVAAHNKKVRAQKAAAAAQKAAAAKKAGASKKAAAAEKAELAKYFGFKPSLKDKRIKAVIETRIFAKHHKRADLTPIIKNYGLEDLASMYQRVKASRSRTAAEGKVRGKNQAAAKKDPEGYATWYANRSMARGNFIGYEHGQGYGEWKNKKSAVPDLPEVYKKINAAREAAEAKKSVKKAEPAATKPAAAPEPVSQAQAEPEAKVAPETEVAAAPVASAIKKGMRKKEVVQILKTHELTWKDLRGIKKGDAKYPLKKQYGAWYKDVMSKRPKSARSQIVAKRQEAYAAAHAAKVKAKKDARAAAKKKKPEQAQTKGPKAGILPGT